MKPFLQIPVKLICIVAIASMTDHEGNPSKDNTKKVQATMNSSVAFGDEKVSIIHTSITNKKTLITSELVVLYTSFTCLFNLHH